MGPTEKVLETLFDTLIKIGTEGAWAYLSVQVPFLNAPVLRTIVKWGLEKVITIVLKKTEVGAYFGIINFKTGHEAKEFEKVALEHLEAVKKGDVDAIKKLEQEKIDAARKLIRIAPY